MTAMLDIPAEALRLARGHIYVRRPEPIDFPAFDPPEEPVGETKRHLENRTALYLLLRDAIRATASVGSEQLVYYDPTDARRCLSPDIFVKLDVPDRAFRVWKTWERGAPEVGVEIISSSDHRDQDWEEKLARYRAAGIREIVRFDAEDREHPIRIWDHVSGDVVERAPDDPERRICHALGLYWVVSQDPEYGPMLRLSRDREGHELLRTASEDRLAAELALRETRRALEAAEHEKLVAEQAARADAEARERAESEIERLKAELERMRRGG